jgi:SAM-dependent methyltransferase
MADPRDRDKVPTELLEDDSPDLEEISVIVEPDKGKDGPEENLPDPETPIESAPDAPAEDDEGEQTQKARKYDPLFEASLQAATPKDQPRKSAENEPSIIIRDDDAPLSPFDEEIDQAAKEASGPIVMGFVKVIGEKAGEKAKEKGSAPPVPPPPPPGAKTKAKSIPPPPKPTLKMEIPAPTAAAEEEEELLEVAETRIKEAEEEIKQAIREVEESLKEPPPEAREASDSREEIEVIGEVEVVREPPKEEEEPGIREALEEIKAAEETAEDEAEEAEADAEEITQREAETGPQSEAAQELPRPAQLSKPQPPPPPMRPSKQPPRPPQISKVEIIAVPPPPVPKGLSMKSIVDHLPAIISIPDDEIPRGEPEIKEVAAAVEVPAHEAVPRVKKKWFEEIFDEDYIRLLPPLTDLHKKREINFLHKTLDLEPGSVILDLACGTGVHCIGLAEKGYQMVGLDLSFAMLAIASEEAQSKGCKINFIQRDLREIDFKEVFDGAYCIGSSFGYFDEDENEKVIASVYSALKPGGMFLLEVDNRDYVLRQAPGLLWFEGDGLVCMEETTFDFITSRLKVKRTLLFEDGEKKMHNYSIRLYSIHELGRMMHKVGFRVDSAGGHRAAPKTFVGEDSSRIIILAQKRFSDET